MKAIQKILAGIALVTAMASVNAQDLIKVGTFVPEKSVGVSKVIKPWMEAVAGEVGDAVKLQGFWGGALGKSPFKQFELVQNGVADVTWVLPGYTAGQFPEMSLFELPFLIRTAEEASVVGWKLHEMGMLNGFDGVHVIGIFAAEPNAIFMKNKISSLDDLENMKVRSVGGIHAAWLESLGASPQTLSSTEMNEALNRGTVDGVIQGWTGMRTFKTLPLVDQAYSIPTGTIPFLLLMNQKKWDSLSDEIKTSVMAHGGLAMAKAGGNAYTDVGQSIRDAVEEEGRIEMLTPDAATIAAYAEKANAVHEDWIKNTPNGQVIYDTAVQLLEAMRGG